MELAGEARCHSPHGILEAELLLGLVHLFGPRKVASLVHQRRKDMDPGKIELISSKSRRSASKWVGVMTSSNGKWHPQITAN